MGEEGDYMKLTVIEGNPKQEEMEFTRESCMEYCGATQEEFDEATRHCYMNGADALSFTQTEQHDIVTIYNFDGAAIYFIGARGTYKEKI